MEKLITDFPIDDGLFSEDPVFELEEELDRYLEGVYATLRQRVAHGEQMSPDQILCAFSGVPQFAASSWTHRPGDGHSRDS